MGQRTQMSLIKFKLCKIIIYYKIFKQATKKFKDTKPLCKKWIQRILRQQHLTSQCMNLFNK